jgi:hypothetical protein
LVLEIKNIATLSDPVLIDSWARVELSTDNGEVPKGGIVELRINTLSIVNTSVSVFDFHNFLQREKRFSEETFGPGPRAKQVVDHIRKELIEIEAEPEDLEEWIDVVLLALDGAWRSGYSPDAIIHALEAKLSKNKNRVWPDWRTVDPEKAIEHIESDNI